MFVRAIKLVCLVLFLSGLACTYAFSLVYVDKEEIKHLKKVAVFPFKNISGKPEAGTVVTQIFFTELVKKNIFEVEGLGDIREFLIKQRIKDTGMISRSTLTMLRNQFKLDAVFIGVVRKYEFKGEIPVVNFTIRLIDTKEGKILWQVALEKTGEDYVKILNIDRIRSLNKLVQRMVINFLDTY